MGGLGVVLVICAYLSILNASSFLIVRSLSVEWPAVVGGCCRDLSDVVATPFSDWYFCVVWLSSSITSCFAAVSSRPFLLYIGLYVPVYSFGKFATYSMISVWTFGSVAHCLYFYLFFSLGCSVFYICRWILLQVCRLFRFGIVL